MDYPLEHLNPEQFQRLCQGLILGDFPSARFFPIGQADGGRDATARRPGAANGTGPLVIFQVKFARNPSSIKNPRRWVREALARELPKIERLVERGATHFRLITNVQGSGALDAGSIDLLDAELAGLPITADAWWRDDVLTRLDVAWDLKWRFPELLTGPDLLRSVIQSGLTEHRDRRASALRAFLVTECDRDQTVRFQQVGLENGLLDLYVDLPIISAQSSGLWRSRTLFRDVSKARETLREPVNRSFYDEIRFGRPATRLAAESLLEDSAPETSPWVVIEGAPGQGKSTVSQYICQVNRLRLLKRADDLEKVPQGLRSGPLRLPFRVDLRDFAAWLHGANPFGEETAPRAGLSRRSLESFLAAQVESFSGGAQFGVSDLHAVARVSSLLIALDGLDEVAVIEERERVVEEATAGLKRLADVAPAIDAVVTTRPAAFENSPGFDRRLFRYFELASLGSEASLLYAEKWIKVRQLEPKAAGAVRRVVREKLDEPHLRELARNPMQLAILLSLIHQRGVSLPDKRTALYDNYVDLFFAREAEKTPNVAEHRDLLLEIHQFLAWRLQTEVENGNSQGSISTDRLKLLLRDYLLREEKDVSLVDVLFSSLVERVVAIVSRVEGTYEFEVQPLREYFAARFLYDTAHHSSPGNERPGDKTDRFDALARNFYWLNATRFFAGCFSKGELLSLVERLEVLAEEDGFRHTDHPRVLASMLLTDWVFAQSPKAMKAVVRIVLRDVAMRGQPSRSDDVFALPLGSGQKEVAERCWELWRQDLPRDRSTAVAETLRRNSVPAEIDAEWLSAMSKASSEERTRWLERGLWTGSLSRAETSSLPKLLADEVGLFDRRRLQALLDAGQAGIYLDDQETRQFAIDAMLDGAVSSATHDAPRSLLGALSQIGTLLNSELVQRADSGWWGRSAPDNWRGQSSRLPRVSYLIRSVRKHVHAGTPWHVSLTPWNEVVEAMRRADGDRWLALELAVAGAGVRDPGDKGSVGHGIFDSEHPLCERARYMRMRYGNAGWWTRHLSEAQTSFDQVFLTAMFVAWASPKTLRAAIEPFDSWFRQAPEEERQAVYRAVKRARLLRNLASANAERADIRELPPVAPETAVAVMERNTIIDADIAIYSAHFKGRHSDCGIVAADLARVANAYARREPGHWPVALEAVAKAYAFGFSSGNAWDEREVRFEVPFARAIVDSAERYPLWVIAAAERVCRGQMGHETIALAAVAAKQDWEWV